MQNILLFEIFCLIVRNLLPVHQYINQNRWKIQESLFYLLLIWWKCDHKQKRKKIFDYKLRRLKFWKILDFEAVYKQLKHTNNIDTAIEIFAAKTLWKKLKVSKNGFKWLLYNYCLCWRIVVMSFLYMALFCIFQSAGFIQDGFS